MVSDESGSRLVEGQSNAVCSDCGVFDRGIGGGDVLWARSELDSCAVESVDTGVTNG